MKVKKTCLLSRGIAAFILMESACRGSLQQSHVHGAVLHITSERRCRWANVIRVKDERRFDQNYSSVTSLLDPPDLAPSDLTYQFP